MDWTTAFTVASGGSGFLGVAAVLFYHHLIKEPPPAVERVARTYNVPPEMIKDILIQFTDADKKLEALHALLNISVTQTKVVLRELEKTRPEMHEQRLHQAKGWQVAANALFVLTAAALVLAVISWLRGGNEKSPPPPRVSLTGSLSVLPPVQYNQAGPFYRTRLMLANSGERNFEPHPPIVVHITTKSLSIDGKSPASEFALSLVREASANLQPGEWQTLLPHTSQTFSSEQDWVDAVKGRSIESVKAVVQGAGESFELELGEQVRSALKTRLDELESRVWKEFETNTAVVQLSESGHQGEELFGRPAAGLVLDTINLKLWTVPPGGPQMEGPVKKVGKEWVSASGGVELKYRLGDSNDSVVWELTKPPSIHEVQFYFHVIYKQPVGTSTSSVAIDRLMALGNDGTLIAAAIRKNRGYSPGQLLTDADLAEVTALEVERRLTDLGATWLADPRNGLENLRTLDLSDSSVTRDGLRAIARSDTGLKNLTAISLFNMGLDDGALQVLCAADTGLKKLSLIDARNSHITDRDLRELARPDSGLVSLKELRLQGVQVREDAINAVRQRFPGIVIQR